MIYAFPYDIPEWMPNELVKLAKCASDPSPIARTVRKVFAEFRRTHTDSWHLDKLKFTSDQLDILSDVLVSHSYYA